MTFDERQFTEVRDIVDQRLEELGLLPVLRQAGATTGRCSSATQNEANTPKSERGDFYAHMAHNAGCDEEHVLRAQEALANPIVRELIEKYKADPALHMYENKQAPAVGNGVSAATTVDPGYDPSCGTCGGHGELSCPRCCYDSSHMCTLCDSSGTVYCRCRDVLESKRSSAELPKEVSHAFEHLRSKGVQAVCALFQDTEDNSWLYFDATGTTVDFPPGCSIDILESADAAVGNHLRPCLFFYK